MFNGGWLDQHMAGLYPADDYRVLKRLDLNRRAAVVNDNAGTKVGLVIDVETTGLAPGSSIIELSLRRFRFDDFGIITKLDRSYGWLEDPGEPLDPAITGMTGLTDEMLRGHRIDDRQAALLLASADVRIAFNASFDRGFVERRLPDVAGRPWACAMREVDWRSHGFDGAGRSLGWLLAQCGFFNDRAHRAAADVDATIAILEHRFASGETALFHLLETASQSGWLVRAVGAHFDVKDRLKGRGYRWDAAETVWTREVVDAGREEELSWLAENVYAPESKPRMDGPSLREVTWFDRHG